MRIAKNKNFLEFYIYEEESKCCKIDLNSGILYGVSGKVLKNAPSNLAKCLERMNEYVNSDFYLIIRYLRELHSWKNIPYTKLTTKSNEIAKVEKIASVIGIFDYSSNISLRNLTDDERNIDIIYNNLKEFAKMDKHSLDVVEFTKRMKIENFCKEYNLKIDEHFTREMASFIVENFSENYKKYYNRIAYYLAKELWDFYDIGSYLERNILRSQIEILCKYCDRMNVEMPKGDFMRNYVEIKRQYLLNKESFDNNAIKTYQLSKEKALFFENDIYTIVIPTTAKEIIEEGERQNNCVGRIYLPRVIKNTTHVVFVRRKSDVNKNYITCEVSEDGEIVQFLKAYNQSPRDTEDLEFRNAYQEWLKKVWE